ncbi:hypothetical protein F1721_21405 [Saccharopolyspora hirsuta]|uniref:Uncharacterized protein n=1 Tax=Saccharopolyspora hirsuta TaxID=1837 RepID=A0A5M7BYA0_SACHI|nr:hypothetical protein F1721_21405 [Saccharopolyspora hirsuta]
MSAHSVAVWSTIVLAAASLALWASLCFYSRRPQHAGGGDGALTVHYLIARVEAETSGSGRHRLHQPAADRTPTNDGTADTPHPAEADDGWTRNPAVLQRILAGLRRW